MTNSPQDIEIVEINEIADEGNKPGAALPNFQALLKMGAIKVNPETGLPDNPENPSKERLIRTRRKDGSITEKVEKVYGGHVIDPNNKPWRIGLNSEIYYGYLEQEYNYRLQGKNYRVAPDLTSDEFDSFREWLSSEQGIDIEEDDVSVQEVVKEIKVRKRAESKRKADSGETTLKKKPAAKKPKLGVVEAVKEDDSDDDLNDL